MHCSTRQLLALQVVNMSLEYGKDKVCDDMLELWFIQEGVELYNHTCICFHCLCIVLIFCHARLVILTKHESSCIMICQNNSIERKEGGKKKVP